MLFSTATLATPALGSSAKYGTLQTKAPGSTYKTSEELMPWVSNISMGSMVEWVSEGRWSQHQLIETLLHHTGPAHLSIATWAIAQKPLEVLNHLKTEGLILSLYGLFESKIEAYHGKSLAYARGFFDEIRLAKCHAKVTVIINDTWQVAVISSANWTVNRRTESGVIICQPQSATFHHNWIHNEP